MAAGNTHYERAFERFLQRRRIAYVAVDQAKKAVFAGVRLKSFDFLLYPSHGPALLADVKGRKLPCRTLAAPPRAGQTWTTLADVEGLAAWEDVFGPGYLAAFIFAYWLVAPSPTDPPQVSPAPTCPDAPPLPANTRRPLDLFEHEGRAYCFWVADLAGYRLRMKPRSPKWNTLYVPRRLFTAWALPFDRYVRSPHLRPPGCESAR